MRNLFNLIPAYREYEGAVLRALELHHGCTTSEAQALIDVPNATYRLSQAFGTNQSPAAFAAELMNQRPDPGRLVQGEPAAVAAALGLAPVGLDALARGARLGYSPGSAAHSAVRNADAWLSDAGLPTYTEACRALGQAHEALDPDTGAPVVPPHHLIVSGAAYWAFQLPRGVHCLLFRPCMAATGLPDWSDPDEAAEVDSSAPGYESILACLLATDPGAHHG